ncbi:hypothetical protein MNBD_BACTEROID05-1319 [hydrothermal vent metagenome]|uniref:Uncharacterized protein n=1 Tax=hydrothermal vent metagenome TaxID=652676 RepID=A0A3B0TQ89_9ZZZZ
MIIKGRLYDEAFNQWLEATFYDHKSVWVLAKKAGLSATVIQDIRSGKQKDMKVKNFIHVVHACGYNVVLDNGKERIPIGV